MESIRLIIYIDKGPTKSWLNYVPAAAVIRKRQALLVINGSKGYVGGIIDLLALTRKEWSLYYYTRV